MSVRQGLMALLAEEPMYGARLRSEFEARTGGTWPLNVGQVYTTLARLERDGLVEPLGGSTGSSTQDPGVLAGPGERTDDDGRILYRLTAAGHAESSAWWTTPVDRDDTPRDELVIKLALAVTAPGVDVAGVVQTQRTATLRHLRDLTRLKASARETEGGDGTSGPGTTTRTPEADLAWSLVLEHLLFTAEAEARWLDHVESRLSQEAVRAKEAGRPRPADLPLDEPLDAATGHRSRR